jgi:putative ATPase
MKDLGYGKEYKYAHDYKENFVDAEFLPDAITGTVFYSPGENSREKAIRDYLEQRWKDKYRY